MLCARLPIGWKHPRNKNFDFAVMTRKIGLDASPPANRWMKDELDRTVFRKSIPVLAASVHASKVGIILNAGAMQRSIINVSRVRSVVSNPSRSNDRLVLLRVSDEAELDAEATEFLKTNSSGFIKYSLDLDYNYWTADDILHAILPEELCDGSPTGFAIIGHIAHMNLNEEYLPYKRIIGQVILDKNKTIKTVVNKLDSIDNQFRVFKMELIAGEPDYVVEHHESDCRFTFDFTQVYWNSRLHTEHDRLIQLFNPEDVVADVFAGVGPFAIPAAKMGCAVLANDLNPNSAKYLQKNVGDNHVDSLIRVSCEDGRDFIKTVVLRALDPPFPSYVGPAVSRTKERRKRREQAGNAPPHTPENLPPRRRISHFVMNLPDSAITFLDAFRGILSPAASSEIPLESIYNEMPMIHCYCFTRELEQDKAEVDIRQRVEEKLGHALPKEVGIHLVRSVAPNKNMYCISFRLPTEVAFA